MSVLPIHVQTAAPWDGGQVTVTLGSGAAMPLHQAPIYDDASGTLSIMVAAALPHHVHDGQPVTIEYGVVGGAAPVQTTTHLHAVPLALSAEGSSGARGGLAADQYLTTAADGTFQRRTIEYDHISGIPPAVTDFAAPDARPATSLAIKTLVDTEVAALQAKDAAQDATTAALAARTLDATPRPTATVDANFQRIANVLVDPTQPTDAANVDMVDTVAADLQTHVATADARHAVLAGRVTVNEADIITNASNLQAVDQDLSTHKAAALATDAAHDARITTNTQNITTNAADLVTERIRAVAAEDGLDVRLTAAEAAIVGNDADIVAIRDDLTAETTRAGAAEAALDTRVAATEASTASHESRLDQLYVARAVSTRLMMTHASDPDIDATASLHTEGSEWVVGARQADSKWVVAVVNLTATSTAGTTRTSSTLVVGDPSDAADTSVSAHRISSATRRPQRFPPGPTCRRTSR